MSFIFIGLSCLLASALLKRIEKDINIVDNRVRQKMNGLSFLSGLM